MKLFVALVPTLVVVVVVTWCNANNLPSSVYEETLVDVCTRINNRGLTSFYTGAIVHSSYVITTNQACNEFGLEFLLWTSQKENVIPKENIAIVGSDPRLRLCVIHMITNFDVQLFRLRVYKHHVKGRQTLEIAGYNTDVAERSKLKSKETQLIFGDEQNKLPAYFMGIKLKAETEAVSGSVLNYQKIRNNNKLVGIIVEKKMIEKNGKKQWYALGVELAMEEVANYIHEKTNKAVTFRKQPY